MSRKAFRIGRSFVLVAAVIVIANVSSSGQVIPNCAPIGTACQGGGGVTSFGLKSSPMPDWFKFETAPTVHGWVNQHNGRAIDFHAWKLWAGVTTLTSQGFRGVKAPVFLTWWPQEDTFNPILPNGAQQPGINFQRPHRPVKPGQAAIAAVPTATATPLPGGNQNIAVTVQYNNEIFKHVRDNHFYSPAVLENINAGFGSAPIATRNLAPFPNSSLMVKPTYLFASATQATQLQYWSGPANSIAPSAPGYGTWTDWMWVLPPAIDIAQFKASHPDGHPVRLVSDFFNFKLVAGDFNPNSILAVSGFNVGDYALLVAMHVASREIPDWTWQTFFWSISPVDIPTGIKNRIKAPFDHYQEAVGYSFTDDGTTSSLPTLCYDPYLEATFDNSVFNLPGQLGIESNCMSCHRAATWPSLPDPSAPPNTSNPGYVANGLINPGDAYFFGGQVKTDFVWGVQNNVAPSP